MFTADYDDLINVIIYNNNLRVIVNVHFLSRVETALIFLQYRMDI